MGEPYSYLGVGKESPRNLVRKTSYRTRKWGKVEKGLVHLAMGEKKKESASSAPRSATRAIGRTKGASYKKRNLLFSEDIVFVFKSSR